MDDGHDERQAAELRYCVLGCLVLVAAAGGLVAAVLRAVLP